MNKAIYVSVPHRLGRAEDRRRIQQGFGDLARHLGGGSGALTTAWTGDRLDFSLQALGQEVSGTCDVADEAVRIEVLLPGFLAMFAGRVKGALQKEGQLLLERK